MRPLVLTGGPAAGKSTCGRALARGSERAAFIDVDDIRQLVVAGDATLWSGEEGERQHRLAARNACAIASNLVADGFEVVIADFVTSDTAHVYRSELPGCMIVHLTISLGEATRRAATRPVHLTDEEFQLLHAIAGKPLIVDATVSVDGLVLSEQIELIRAVWRDMK